MYASDALLLFRVLDVGLDLMKVSFKGFKALSNLQHLAEFIFYFPLPENKRQDRYDQILDHNIKNYKASMYYMPKLRVVGERMIRDTRQELDHVQVFVYCNEEALRNLRIPSTLGLQELIVSTPPVAGIEFPNLTSLLLYHKGDPWQSHEPLCCSSLVSLTELIIFNQRDLNISFYKKILNQVAVQLKSLWLYLGSAEVDEVLRLCPNLTHFHADGILKLASTVTPHTLRNLHVLELRFDERVDVNPELLLQLLQAPKLRELLIVCKFPSLPEHVPIVNMLEEHTILQKLEQVVLVETQQYAPGVANYSTCVMEAMISCCPNLVDVSYKLRTKNYL